eukprot:4285467-Amphidinium_carterae.1
MLVKTLTSKEPASRMDLQAAVLLTPNLTAVLRTDALGPLEQHVSPYASCRTVCPLAAFAPSYCKK